MGTGKSTLATALSETLSLEMLSTDAIRRELFSSAPQSADYNEGNYAPELRRRVYEELLNRAGQQVNQGASVVMDGAFLTNELREAAVALAQRAGAVLLLVRCQCSAAVARKRIAARLAAGRSLSEARPDLLSQQEHDDEPLLSKLPQLKVDSTTSLGEQIDAVIQRLAIESMRQIQDSLSTNAVPVHVAGR